MPFLPLRYHASTPRCIGTTPRRCCSHLVDFFGAFKRPDGSIRVVLEYMDRGSLADVTEYRQMLQVRRVHPLLPVAEGTNAFASDDRCWIVVQGSNQHRQ